MLMLNFLIVLIVHNLIIVESKLNRHEAIDISDEHLSKLNAMSDMNHFRETLDKILIPRIVGTPGHTKVRNFIINSMEDLNWQIDRDVFTDETPNMGKLQFENIIATQNPNAKRFLVFACHYDSKYIPKVKFYGATDSAVPCAMLINMAKILNNNLIENSSSVNNDVSLMFIFFDGEEAFLEWGPKDSIYGARHLAKKWKDNGFLEKIDLLLLLDLIGLPDPKFYSFFENTEKWHSRMINIEERLSELDYLENYTSSGMTKTTNNRYFTSLSANSYIEDDHIPFLKLGVPILHLIPIPFPDVWHTVDDNINVIDFTTVENLNKILRIFVAEYLKMNTISSRNS